MGDVDVIIIDGKPFVSEKFVCAVPEGGSVGKEED